MELLMEMLSVLFQLHDNIIKYNKNELSEMNKIVPDNFFKMFNVRRKPWFFVHNSSKWKPTVLF